MPDLVRHAALVAGGVIQIGIPEVPATTTASSASAALESVARSASEAVIAYGSLYTVARLMYRPDVCDLADANATAWIEAFHELNDALPDVLAADLRRHDLVCRCVCPACGIGACRCVRNSIETMPEVWGRPGLAPEVGTRACGEGSRGVERRIEASPCTRQAFLVG